MFQWLSNWGIEIDNHCNCKKRIEHILPKLSTACFAAWRFFQILSIDILRLVYFASFHSILKHGIIFLGNSTNICHVFTLQKRIITISLVYGLTAHAQICSIN